MPIRAISPAASGSGWRWRSPSRGAWRGRRCPGLVALDEPTRGMDRARKDELVGSDRALAKRGAGVLVATHDVEFAAAFAERVVLLGEGVVIADGPADEVLSGGWYFATEVARVLDLPGVDHPRAGRRGAARRGRRGRMSWQAGQLPHPRRRACSAALPGMSARGRPPRWSPWSPRWPRWRSPAGSPSPPSPTSSRPPTSSSSPATRSAARPGFAVGALTALVSNFWFGQGPWTPWQMAGLGPVRDSRRRAGPRRPQRRPADPRRGLRLRRHRLRRSAQLLPDGDLRRRPVAAALPRAGGAGGALRCRPRDRQHRPSP